MKEDFFSVNFLIALAFILSMGLVIYNSFMMPDYGPPVVAPVPIEVSTSQGTQETAAVSSSEQQSASSVVSDKKDPYAIVNINTATEEELQTISGIGPVLAAEILQYRGMVGVITDIGELMDVNGIGEATFVKIAPHFVLE